MEKFDPPPPPPSPPSPPPEPGSVAPDAAGEAHEAREAAPPSAYDPRRERILQNTIHDLARRIDELERRMNEAEVIAAAVDHAHGNLGDYELGYVAQALERRAKELTGLAKVMRAEQDKRFAAAAAKKRS